MSLRLMHGEGDIWTVCCDIQTERAEVELTQRLLVSLTAPRRTGLVQLLYRRCWEIMISRTMGLRRYSKPTQLHDWPPNFHNGRALTMSTTLPYPYTECQLVKTKLLGSRRFRRKCEQTSPKKRGLSSMLHSSQH